MIPIRYILTSSLASRDQNRLILVKSTSAHFGENQCCSDWIQPLPVQSQFEGQEVCMNNFHNIVSTVASVFIYIH
jgi:hypothetical protein